MFHLSADVDGGTFEVEAITLDEITGWSHAGNLDADLELWIYRNADVGWEQLLDHGNAQSRGDVIGKLRWPENSPDAEPGRYAVAVKSEGGVGDLGRYGVVARGQRIHAIESAFIDPEPEPKAPVTNHGLKKIGGF